MRDEIWNIRICPRPLMFKSYNGSHFDFVFLTAPFSLFSVLDGIFTGYNPWRKACVHFGKCYRIFGSLDGRFHWFIIKKKPIEQIKPNKINMNLIACFILKNSTITGWHENTRWQFVWHRRQTRPRNGSRPTSAWRRRGRPGQRSRFLLQNEYVQNPQETSWVRRRQGKYLQVCF